MPLAPDPRGRPPIKRLAIILVIVVLVAVVVFVGYNISHYQQINEEGPSGQPAPAAQQQAP
ncbi:hypothetical protein [Sphingomonas sp. 3-13AW]|uniref:hypothetical protein n=1 Tax=Sphingomonas sp. 3-13AW TaxID=3050450 RepID=UPI003BB4B0D4